MASSSRLSDLAGIVADLASAVEKITHETERATGKPNRSRRELLFIRESIRTFLKTEPEEEDV